MPTVEVKLSIAAPAEETWQAVSRIEDYADYMDSVNSVRVTDSSGTRRVSEWSVLLKGSTLEWVEEDEIDDADRTMTFRQLTGDLDHFGGYWRVDPDGDHGSVTTFFVEFEIGIPLLADMLNPVAAKALRDNAEQMLTSIEQRVVAP
ncbi:SRPBCC family protein [Streptomyces griseoloalbus]|uniref:type II toxin-antitoxin system RatA family toxin n=1 Tax=Streptomyces griseoloalbus TaxID=67303 RepID=UPI0033BEAB36